jgi:anti-sigma factor RsiW
MKAVNGHLSAEQVVGYVHYTLTDAERETMDEHLARCAECRARVAGCEALERRIRYSLSADIRTAAPPSSMTFAAVAPRLQHRSWRSSFRAEVASGAVGLAALAGLTVALVGFFQSLQRSGVPVAQPAGNPLPLLASFWLGAAVMGNYGLQRSLSSRWLLAHALALALWAGTALVGLEAILVVLDVLGSLFAGTALPGLVALAVLPLGMAWIALVVGGGEYHVRYVGRRRSWRLFAWTVAVELVILALPYVMDGLGRFERFWS